MHCKHLRFLGFLDFSMTLGSNVTGLVLQRVHAHYARNKKLLWALVSLWAVSCCAALTGLIAALAEVIRRFSQNLYHTLH